MNALVVFDSQYGNTAQVARAIAAELEQAAVVRVASVRDSVEIDPTGVDLLLIGGPTQGHGISPPLRLWLDGVPPDAFEGIPAATFDTRLRWPMFLSGSAARSLAKILKRHGARLVAEPASFIVQATEGPLAEGEIERATTWARAIVQFVRAGAAEPSGSRRTTGE